MKENKTRRTRGEYDSKIITFLAINGGTIAAEIAKMIGFKGDLYYKLNQMIEAGLVVKNGRLYSLSPKGEEQTKASINEDPRMPLFKPRATQPDAYTNLLKKEHEHLMKGIEQLQITANYLSLRIKERERAAR